MAFERDASRVPQRLTAEQFALRPIAADDAAMDYAAVMDSLDHLRVWEQSGWPADDFTVEANREDLVGLEQRHRDGRAYTYTVVTPDGSRCIGCVYVFPLDATFLTKASVTAVADDRWADVDAVVYFWVRRDEMDAGLDAPLLTALRGWFTDGWGFWPVVYVTHEDFTQQMTLLGGSGLSRKFELRGPGKPGTYVAFG